MGDNQASWNAQFISHGVWSEKHRSSFLGTKSEKSGFKECEE